MPFPTALAREKSVGHFKKYRDWSGIYRNRNEQYTKNSFPSKSTPCHLTHIFQRVFNKSKLFWYFYFDIIRNCHVEFLLVSSTSSNFNQDIFSLGNKKKIIRTAGSSVYERRRTCTIFYFTKNILHEMYGDRLHKFVKFALTHSDKVETFTQPSLVFIHHHVTFCCSSVHAFSFTY